MSRRDRRAAEAKLRTALRRRGCRCRPTFCPDDDDALRGWVRHAAERPFADTVARLWAAGIMAEVTVAMPSRCQR